MLFEVVCISFAFLLGLLVRLIGLPPLVGFLAAGFAINALSDTLHLPEEAGAVLSHLSHLGVLLLLFTLGLKLHMRSLLQPPVVGGALLHFAVSCLLFAPGLYLVLDLDARTAMLLGMALAFSSTVLAAKFLEAKHELRAFHGRVAIGILIVQDLIALGVLSVFGDHSPSVWAPAVVLLPLLRPALMRLLDWMGHDELLVLMGLLLALVVGGVGFERLGLSPELGALVMGMLLAGHPRAQELSKALWSLKEVFLVGFFLQIGMSGLPDWSEVAFATTLVLLLPVKAGLFFAVLLLFRLRARNAFLAGATLTCYSEFGLIVAAGLIPEWLVPLALAVALSFLVAAPFNRLAHPLFERLETRLNRWEGSARRHPDEQPTTLGHASAMVLGMGRTGTSAYDALTERGARVIGIDADPGKVAAHRGIGRRVVYADVEDSTFWHGADLSHVRAVILATGSREASLFATRQLRLAGFSGLIIAHAFYPDEAEAIRAAGADQAYQTMAEAGVGLAGHAWAAIDADKPA